MSSRKRRHTKSTFSDLVHPNFEELSRNYPDFGRAWQAVRQHQKEHGGSLSSNVTQEFSIATTRALLHTYFSLNLPQIPSLCPPIPNRYYFVRWITKDLLPLIRNHLYFEPLNRSATEAPRTHFGIDLGTGATCIYPLLFCASSVDIEDHVVSKGEWKWLASEIDPTSTEMANQNVKANRLASKIEIIKVQSTGTQMKINNDQDKDQDGLMDVNESGDNNIDSPSDTPGNSGPLLRVVEALPLEFRPTGLVDVIMTNPPFHDPESPHQKQPVRAGDQRARTSLTQSEASYPGGEVQFIVDLVVDSLRLLPHPSQSQQVENQPTLTALWSSSMFGKKASWIQVNRILTYMLGPARMQSTEFGPGNLTRWFLAWTFCCPSSRSPLATYCPKNGTTNSNNVTQPKTSTMLSFNVTLEEESDISRGLLPVVMERVITCFTTFPGFNLTAQVVDDNTSSPCHLITVREATPHIMEWDSHLLPPAILEVLQRRRITFMDFLPQDGHFVIDVKVSACSTAMATVELKGYVHSQYGRKVIDKIATHIQSDVCRTSRRWRRLLQRQQNQVQDQHQQPMMES